LRQSSSILVGPAVPAADGDQATGAERTVVADYCFITYEELDDGRIARITLNRPHQRNAQNRGLLVELDAAFVRAEEDDTVRVVILKGNGLSFSSGHDLGSKDAQAERAPSPDRHPSFGCNGGTAGPVEMRHRQEWHHYFAPTPSVGATSARSQWRRCTATYTQRAFDLGVLPCMP
jgi:enoyl-CoA hydratase